MAITSINQTRSGDMVLVTALSDLAGARFYWYFDGAYVGATGGGARGFALSPGEQARVAVLDSVDPAFDPIADGPIGYPGRVTLEWVRPIGTEDIAWYLVEQRKNGGAYVTLARVRHRPGRWSYRYTTGRLDDLANYVWRITPIDAVGNLSPDPVINASRLIVRWPDAPAFAAAYDAISDRVIVEAA